MNEEELALRQMESALLDSMYYHPDFQVIIEDHLLLLRANPTGYIEVADNEAYRFEFDYYNLLRFKGIPYKYHWIVMRVNDFLSPFDAHQGIKRIIIPDYQRIERLFNMYLTVIGQVQ